MTLEEFRQHLSEWDRAIWSGAAFAVAMGTAAPPLRRAAEDVLDAVGMGADQPGRVEAQRAATPAQLAAVVASSLHQCATLAGGGALSWDDMPDEALVTQGRQSAQAPAALRQLLASLPGLEARLARPGARMLDVGTGIGALAAAFAEAHPALQVVGVDASDRVLALAGPVVAASPARDRVDLRLQDVATLTDRGQYDLVWVPAPFLPPEPLRAGLVAVRQALKPGGWVLLGHGRYGEDPVGDALTRFRTLVFGGTPLDDEQAGDLMRDVGLVDVRRGPTPSPAPAVTVGRAAEE